MENLQKELLELSQNWNASGKYDDTEFAGRYFISDYDFDKLAKKANCLRIISSALATSVGIDQNKFEQFFDCRIEWDTDKPIQGLEIIFKKEGKTMKNLKTISESSLLRKATYSIMETFSTEDERAKKGSRTAANIAGKCRKQLNEINNRIIELEGGKKQ